MIHGGFSWDAGKSRAYYELSALGGKLSELGRGVWSVMIGCAKFVTSSCVCV